MINVLRLGRKFEIRSNLIDGTWRKTLEVPVETLNPGSVR